nr:Ycf39 [Madagascaria erythrocladioides]
MTLLVTGATGTLGRQIVRQALNEGYQVKCLVRNIKKASFLKEWGAELVYGDLSIPETIPQALYGITAIIDTATSRPSDSYKADVIDLTGKKILIEAAQLAKIKRYIFFSFLKGKMHENIPLINLKLEIEQELKQSNLNYTIFYLAGFFQGLINQYAIPILDNQSIWMTKESSPIAYMDTQDIAKFTVRSLSLKNAENKTFPLVGPKSWTSQEIIRLCEKLGGKKAKITSISIIILKILRYFTSLFQWTQNISDRLAFAEILTSKEVFSAEMENIYQDFNLNSEDTNSLEKYLQEYFSKILKRVQQVNYKNENSESKF